MTFNVKGPGGRTVNALTILHQVFVCVLFVRQHNRPWGTQFDHDVQGQ